MNSIMIDDCVADSCAVCRTFQTFERNHRSIRETYRCGSCKALLREREQARAILDTFAELKASNLADLVENSRFSRLRIYEPGTACSLRAYLKKISYYQQSDFYDDPTQALVNIPHQNLETLTFADNSFDLIVSSDIFEHII